MKHQAQTFLAPLRENSTSSQLILGLDAMLASLLPIAFRNHNYGNRLDRIPYAKSNLVGPRPNRPKHRERHQRICNFRKPSGLLAAAGVDHSSTDIASKETGSTRMGKRDWSETVEDAVRRHVTTTDSAEFSRQELIDAEMPQIVEETGSQGKTPEMTLSRELQQLRDRGVIDFVDDHGNYRLIA